MKVILADIDHTLSDAEWRDDRLELAKKTGNWDDYHSAAYLDLPIFITISIVRSFINTPGISVYGLTGRDEKWKRSTQIWLFSHGIEFKDILMRGEGDKSPSPILKVNLIRKHFPDLSKIMAVIEDRDDCTAAFRELGLNVIQFHKAREIEYEKIKEASKRS